MKKDIQKKTKDKDIWKILTITNLVIIIALVVFITTQFLPKNTMNEDEYYNENYEEELLAQGYEKIDEGFYGMVIGGSQNGKFTEKEKEIADKITQRQEFKPEYPLTITLLDEQLEQLKKETEAVYGKAKKGNYEIRFPSYFVIYDYEQDEIIKWFYFQTIDISG